MAIDLNDKTANGNTLTNNGAAEVSTSLPFAQSSTAVDLENADSDNLSAVDSVSLSVTGNLTLEGWFKFESLPSGGNRMYLLGKNGAAADRGYRFALFDNAGTNEMEISISGDGTATTVKVVTWVASVDTWYHLAVVYTAAAGTADFYVNGVAQGAQQSGLPTSIFDSTSLFHNHR